MNKEELRPGVILYKQLGNTVLGAVVIVGKNPYGGYDVLPLCKEEAEEVLRTEKILEEK